MVSIKENASDQVENVILPPLSNDWFTKSTIFMIRIELEKKELQNQDLEYLDNRILTLESHELCVDSVIRSKILLKKNKVYASCGGSLNLLKAVKDSLEQCQTFRHSLCELRQFITSKCLNIYYYMYLYSRYMNGHDILKILCHLKHNLQLTQEKLDSDDLQAASVSISSFKTFAAAQTELLNHHSTQFQLKMRHKNEEQYDELFKKMQLKLKNSFIQCLDDSNVKICCVTLAYFFQCFSHLENDTFLVNFVITAFSELLEKECQKCLMSFANEEWKKSLHEDTFSLSIEDLLEHIDSTKCVEMFLMFFRVCLNIWTIYAEIVLWATQQAKFLKKKKLNNKNKPNARVNMVEDTSFSVLQKLGFNMLSKESEIFKTQKKTLLSLLSALRLDQVPFTFSNYFLIYVLVHRFVLEVYCILNKSSDTWENVTGFHDMDLPLRLECIPCLKCFDDSLKKAVEIQFPHFLDQQLTCFQQLVLKDAWEGISVFPHFHLTLKHLEHLKCVSLKSLALYDEAIYPAYFSKKNPFQTFQATVTWKCQYSFFMQNITNENEGDHSKKTDKMKSYIVTQSTNYITEFMMNLLKLLILYQHIADQVILAIFICFDMFLYSISHIFSKKLPLQDLLHVLRHSSNHDDCPQLEELHRVFLFQEKYQRLSSLLQFIAGILKKCESYEKELTKESCENEKYSDKNFYQKYPSRLQSLQLPQHRVFKFHDAKHTVLHSVYKVFHASTFKRIALLKSPGALWGLAAKVTGMECCLTVLFCLTEIVHSVHNVCPLWDMIKTFSYPFESWLNWRQEAYDQLLQFLYSQAAQNLFDLKPLVFIIRSWKWDNDHQQLHFFLPLS
ncbi:uncharacterized protein LOC128883450 isoform X2 [Hylaeus volcanicus]|uniref:uncharacterized protein LOC128883450 isoform X2 n=1 Tax=Hylaeus volcanicus TaxID=313075 RepID=UPI0023B7E451|nr:uncharacterized protein LOC128883450 isoform X2 [Hylaeus volcanicus]